MHARTVLALPGLLLTLSYAAGSHAASVCGTAPTGELRAEPGPADETVAWEFRRFVRGDGRVSARAVVAAEIVHTLARPLFRPFRARVGFALTSEQDPYGGHGLFQVHFIEEPEPRAALCCCYVANEQTIGTWTRLYWYGPDHALSSHATPPSPEHHPFPMG